MAEINRLQGRVAGAIHQQRQTNVAERKARTRTLIQAGALLKLVGFFETCQIKEGEDLQLDFEKQDKAATLLGMLTEAFEAMPLEPSLGQLEHWKTVGIRIMKMQKAKQYRL